MILQAYKLENERQIIYALTLSDDLTMEAFCKSG